MKKKIIMLIVFSAVLLAPIFSLKVPKLDGPVVDKAGVISASDEVVIEQLLIDLERTTSAQVAILTVPDLGNESLEEYALAVAEEWQLGQADKDNGALILLALREKKVRIEVGYGLEGDLTDAKSGYIIREIILPQFRGGNYAQGLYDGASAVSGVVLKTADISAEEIAASNRSSSNQRSSSGRSIPFNIIIFIIIILFSSIGRMGRRGRRRGGILPWFFLGSMMGNNRHDRFGSGGSSGFGGGGFGGFSGGGGGFGGGGASGGW